MKKTSDLPHTETVRSQTVKNFYLYAYMENPENI